MRTSDSEGRPRRAPTAPVAGTGGSAGGKLLLVLGGVVAGLVLAELALQLAARVLPSRMDVLRQSRVPVAIPDARLGTRPNPDFRDHDENGYRNASVPKTAFVVALGDSQTYGTGVRREENWPHRLQEKIGRTVYGISCAGWGPVQGLLLIDQALAFRPRLVVQAFYAGNDLFDSFQSVYVEGKLPELATADAALSEALGEAQRRETLEANYQRQYTLVFGPEDEAPPAEPVAASFRGFLREHSRLYRLAAILRWSATSRRSSDWEGLKEEISTGPAAASCAVLEKGDLRTVLTPAYRSGALDLDDPRLAEGLRIAEQAFALSRERARAAGAGYVVLIIPTKELAFADAAAEVLAGNRDYAELIRREEAIRSRLAQFLRERGIPSADALPALQASIARGVQPYPESPDGHPNPAGQRVIADAVAAEMARLGLPSGGPAR
jgi:lysophospholipase L1-like esterase